MKAISFKVVAQDNEGKDHVMAVVWPLESTDENKLQFCKKVGEAIQAVYESVQREEAKQ